MSESFAIYFKPKEVLLTLLHTDDHYSLQSEVKSWDNVQTPDSTTVIDELPSFLSEGEVFVVDSVNSGKGRANETNLYSAIVAPLLERLEINHTYIETTSASSITEFAQNFNTPDAKIIFLSGDTSINEFINGLTLQKKSQSQSQSAKSIYLYPIPLGTGNSFALSLDLTSPLQSVSRLLASKQASPLHLYNLSLPQGSFHLVQNSAGDVVESADLKFIVVFSWAFHASLVADSDTPELRKHGLERFQIAARNNLSRTQEYEGDIIITNAKSGGKDVIEGPFAYFLLTPSTRFEPTFDISPKGNIFDTNLYLVAFRTQRNHDSYIMDIMMQAYDKGKHTENPDVIYRRINRDEQVTLLTKNSQELQQRRFCVDGSIIALPNVSSHKIDVQAAGNTVSGYELFVIH
ncbi:uncharacterized protein LODBEIA_P48240 [Lodderomyces beijingensis]|uniref:DAGKc domain-containing protein n=1 Tax=Lodderomyces beijingensis TaxID=1775926 RepID=A0ABP0ZR07_9ASCO